MDKRGGYRTTERDKPFVLRLIPTKSKKKPESKGGEQKKKKKVRAGDPVARGEI